jgi:hypothetical protein
LLFAKQHPKRPQWIFGIVVVAIVGTGWFFLFGEWYIWGWAVIETIALVIHENDKIKRAMKATGRVVIDAFGRLRIHPIPQGA